MIKKLRTIIILVLLVAVAGSISVITVNAATTPPEATLTVTETGGTPSVTEGSFSSLIASVKSMTLPTKNTTYTLTLNKDASWSSSWAHTMNSYATLTVDLNGYTLSSSVNGNIFTPEGGMKIIIDGANDSGVKGTIKHTGTAGALVYQKSGTNANAVATVKNLNMIYTNMSAGYSNTSEWLDQPMMHIPQGKLIMNGVSVTYTGADASFSSSSTAAKNGATGISAMSSDFVRVNGGTAEITNCEFNDTNKKGIKTVGISASATSTVTVKDTKIKAYNGVAANNTANVTVEGCDISSRDVLYVTNATGAKITVNDTDSRPPESYKFVSGSGTVKLTAGNGKNKVYSSAAITGKFTLDSGKKLCILEPGVYLVGSPDDYSTVTMSTLFSDYMVFQRNKPIKVFGYCEKNGATVSVVFDGVTKTATVSNGEWSVDFGKKSAAKDLTLSVTQNGVKNTSTLTFSHIDIGEVWMISGQSNAAYQSYKMKDFAEYSALADAYGNIRALVSPSVSLPVEDKIGRATWCEVNSTTLNKNSSIKGDVPAIGLVIATRLVAELGDDITVAVVDATYAGSKMKTWLQPEQYVKDFGTSTTDYTNYNAYKSFYENNGRLPQSASEITNGEYFEPNKLYSSLLSANYNAIVAPLEGYSLAGAVWYQGESDLGNGSEAYHPTYKKMLKTLISGFRKNSNDSNLPVFLVQLHPYGVGLCEKNSVQYDMAYNDGNKNTYLVTSLFEGCVFGYDELAFTNAATTDNLVHPTRKSPIGNRLADSILKNVYSLDKNYVTESPEVVKVTRSGSSIVITFDTDIKLLFGSSAEGFEIAGSDGTWKTATATVSGKTITLTSSSVTTPTQVRYGYGKMQIELQSGKLVEYDGDYENHTQDSTTRVVKLKIGSSYVTIKEGDVIRSRAKGNVTNLSGHPLAVFKLNVGYTRAS